MIYLFENPNNETSIVYDDSTLTEQEKLQGIAFEVIPQPTPQEGKIAILKCRKSDESVWYDYIDDPKVEIQQAIDEYTLSLIEMGVL